MSGVAVVTDITSSLQSMMKLANVFVFRIQIRIRQKNEKNMKVQSSTVPDTPYFSGQAGKKRKKKEREKMSGRSEVRIISDLCDSM